MGTRFAATAGSAVMRGCFRTCATRGRWIITIIIIITILVIIIIIMKVETERKVFNFNCGKKSICSNCNEAWSRYAA